MSYRKGQAYRRAKEMVGKKYHKWTVVRIDRRDQNGRCYLRVRCECGSIRVIPACKIISGERRRCHRCALKANCRSAHSLVWKVLLKGARERNIKVTVTKGFIYKLLDRQNSTCALSGVLIKIASTGLGHSSGETSASVDRIDSSKNYSKRNVQWVHKTINFMKGTLSQEEFVSWCKAVAIHSGGCIDPNAPATEGANFKPFTWIT